MYATVKLRTYLLGQTFLIFTDHQALTFLLKTTYYSSRLMRWFLLLQQYSYDIAHCRGKDNIIADYFSRVSPNGAGFEPLDGPTNSNLIIREPTEILCAIKLAEPWIPELREIRQRQQQDKSLDRWRKNALEKDNSLFKIVENVLFYKGKRDEQWRVVVPAGIREKLIDAIHENFGHVGVFKTWAILDQHFRWRGSRRMTKNRVKCCDLCQRIKHLNFSMAGNMKHVTPSKPNELVTVDYYGPLPRSTGGVEYLFVVVDVFSRLVTLYPLKRATAAATMNRMKQYFETVGRPDQVLSDHETQYTSEKWISFLKDSGIEPVFCSIRHPESNPAERTMRELGRFFRAFCSDRHTAWARYVKDINALLNVTTHSVTGYTPHELHYNKKPTSKIRSLIRFPNEQVRSHEIKIHLANQRTMEACKRREKTRKRRKIVPLKIGDLVLLRVPKLSSALDRTIAKFFHLFYGPYEIARMFNENGFELSEIRHSERVVGRYNRADLRVYYALPFESEDASKAPKENRFEQSKKKKKKKKTHR